MADEQTWAEILRYRRALTYVINVGANTTDYYSVLAVTGAGAWHPDERPLLHRRPGLDRTPRQASGGPTAVGRPLPRLDRRDKDRGAGDPRTQGRGSFVSVRLVTWGARPAGRRTGNPEPAMPAIPYPATESFLTLQQQHPVICNFPGREVVPLSSAEADRWPVSRIFE